MKNNLAFLTFLLLFNLGFCQMDTEIYAFDLDASNDGFSSSNHNNKKWLVEGHWANMLRHRGIKCSRTHSFPA